MKNQALRLYLSSRFSEQLCLPYLASRSVKVLPGESQDIFCLVLRQEIGVFILPQAEEAVQVKLKLLVTHAEL